MSSPNDPPEVSPAPDFNFYPYTINDVWLDQPILDAQNVIKVNAAYRASQLLKRHGIITVRDVIVSGERRISDFRNVGSGTLKGLKDVVASAPFELEWPVETTPLTVSQTCSQLYQVNAQALRRRDETHRMRYYDFPYKASVEDVLHAGEANVTRLLARNTGFHLPDFKPVHAYEDAVVFATKFYKIKTS